MTKTSDPSTPHTSQPASQPASPPAARKAKKHHHGDLRNALIQAGIELLEDGGIDALSLRKCAIRAGVSHAAPTHHFKGLEGLTVAIAERGFEIFADHLEEALAQSAADPRSQLKAICRGYLQFGRAHSGILNVIFGKTGLAEFKQAFLAANAGKDMQSRDTNRAYGVLREVCAPFVPDPDKAWIVEWQVWSLIHGFTLLYVAGEFGASDPYSSGGSSGCSSERANAEREDGPFEAVLALLDGLELASNAAKSSE